MNNNRNFLKIKDEELFQIISKSQITNKLKFIDSTKKRSQSQTYSQNQNNRQRVSSPIISLNPKMEKINVYKYLDIQDFLNLPKLVKPKFKF